MYYTHWGVLYVNYHHFMLIYWDHFFDFNKMIEMIGDIYVTKLKLVKRISFSFNAKNIEEKMIT